MSQDERFKALANERRRAVLHLVRDEPKPVGLIADSLGVSQPAASQHLAVLREAGLVSVRSEGRTRWYSADLDAVRELRSYFDDYWSGATDRLAAAAESAAAARRVAS